MTQNFNNLLKTGWNIFAYGFLIVICWHILVFISSLFFSTEIPKPEELVIGSILFAPVMGYISYLFSRRLKVKNLKEALKYGISWTLVLLGVLLLITIGNETTQIWFGNWATYLFYIGIAIGPIFPFLVNKPKVTN